MIEKIDKLYQEYLNEKLDLIFDWEKANTVYHDLRYKLMSNNGTIRASDHSVYIYGPKGNDLFDLDIIGYASDFVEGYTILKGNGSISYIDYTGRVLFGRIEDGCYGCNYEFAMFLKDGLDLDMAYPFNEGYARVKRKGKYNIIDYRGKWMFREWVNDASDVQFGVLNITRGRKHEKIYIGMSNYQVKRKVNGYECSNSVDKFVIKYQPVKKYGYRYTLCTNKKEYFMYDRIGNEYIPLGNIVKYDDSFVYNSSQGKIFLLYENQMIEITDYYNKNIKDRETINITPGVTGILTREEFGFLNISEIEELMAEERKENQKKQDEQKKEQELVALKKAKEEADYEEMLQNEREFEILKQLQSLLTEYMDLNKKGNTQKKIELTTIYYSVANHKEIPPLIIEMLKIIDLSPFDFKNVKVDGIDFSGTNAKFNPQDIYQKNLRNCNFSGMFIGPWMNFRDVDIRGCTFTSDDDPMTIDKGSMTFEEAIYDDTTTFDGIPLAEWLNKMYGNKKGK